MNDTINKAMDDAILERIKALDTVHPGDEDFKESVDSLTKLYSVRVDEYKAECDFYDRTESHKREMDLREKELDLKARELDLKEQEISPKNTGRIIDWCLRGSEIVIPLGFYGFWMGACLKFEETGAFSSMVSRTILSKVKGK